MHQKVVAPNTVRRFGDSVVLNETGVVSSFQNSISTINNGGLGDEGQKATWKPPMALQVYQ